MYTIFITPEALKDIKKHKKAGDKSILRKINVLLEELKIHPRTGTGKPEQLRYLELDDVWSRRITGKHRLIYIIEETQIKINIIKAYGHYDDK